MSDGTGHSASKRISIKEHLAPLQAAMPEPWTGRIRSLTEARRALQIPTSAEPQVLQAWGVPHDFHLVVDAISEPSTPDLVAEYAALRVIRRRGNTLMAGGRLRIQAKSNALWIVYGSIVMSANKRLVIESLAIGPAFDQQLSQLGDDLAHGVTSQLLRLISPPQLLVSCVEALTAQASWGAIAASHRVGASTTSHQPTTSVLTRERRLEQTETTDDELAAMAKLYLDLYEQGNLRPHAKLAREFGITPSQARNRIHKARRRGYLTQGTQGRAGAGRGPRLLPGRSRSDDSGMMSE